jgi:hypothetical protein
MRPGRWLATGRRIRVLTIVDIFSRFSPAVDPRFNYRGEDVVLTLERSSAKSLAITRRQALARDRKPSPGIDIGAFEAGEWQTEVMEPAVRQLDRDCEAKIGNLGDAPGFLGCSYRRWLACVSGGQSYNNTIVSLREIIG